MRKWWGRLRIPLGLLVLIGVLVSNADTLGSGEPRAIVGTVAWAGFWGWLFLRPMGPRMSVPPTAAELRSRHRPILMASGIWTLIFILVVAWGALDRNSLPLRSLVPIIFPLLLLVSAWFGYARADVIAKKAAQAHAGH